MPGSDNLSHLLMHMQPLLHDGEFVIATLPHGRGVPHLALGSFNEDEATTIYLPKQVAVDLGIKTDSVWALITPRVHSSLCAVGFLARVTAALAAHAISVNPISAFYHDHLFVPYDKRYLAMEVLSALAHSEQPSALVVHGTLSSPHGNWLPWLNEKLSACGYKVLCPQFPTPANQSLDGWLAVFESLDLELNAASVLVGHSLGATFILHLLERASTAVRAAFLVSTPTQFIGISQYDTLNQTFIRSDFNWEKIKSNALTIEILHGEKDPYVPLAQALNLGASLNVPVTVIPGAQHINSEDGHLSFELLLERIRTTCQ